MSSLHGKVDGLGDTFVGRILIAKPEKKATPAPAKVQKASRTGG
jgi:hypothetical protein